MSRAWPRTPATGTLLLCVPLVLVAIVAQTAATPALSRTIVNFLIALVLVLAIQLFAGNSGIVSFGHVAFMGVGAYVAAFLTIPPAIKASILPALPAVLARQELGLVPSLLIAGAAGAVVAGLFGLALTRMEETAMATATFALLLLFDVVVENWTDITRGSVGLFGIPAATSTWTALALAIGALVLARAFRESDLGLKLRASRGDPVAASALGVRVVRLRWIAWTLSGGVMAVGGALWAQYNFAFGPAQFSFAQTFGLLAMLIVGGLGSVSGAVLGAALITVASELLRRAEEGIGVPGLSQITIALLILLVLYRRPHGLLGFSELDRLGPKRSTAPAATAPAQTGSASAPL